ncbi:TonB-dependent receptor [Sphingomonas soli]|uniref:TonB-dependent receptor n=1 Tax=Sphingomonas soli TaxID=266127 RepID=UPI000833BED4|nr:TonB-dependent receptor [Sphingomonas soli]
MINRAILLGASALAVVWSGSAAAQTAPQSAPSEAAEQGGEDEIVVTATRRSENLMTSAISATVLSGTDLENKGVVNVDALQFAMPSIVVNNFGQGNDFNVRGIGKAEHNTQTTTGVITYRDGVPSFPGYFQGEPYYDVANIQVLRGPQGTIVGQNATGGAVFVNTNDPMIDGGNHGYFNVNYGNYNEAGFQGAVNLPISSTFAARAAVYTSRRDSFFNVKGPGGAPYAYDKGDVGILSARLSLLWKPSDNLTISSKTDYSWIDMGAYPASPFANYYKTLPGTNTPNPNYRDLYDVSFNAPQAARDHMIRQVLKAELETAGGVKLRSVSSYQWGNTMYQADLDGTSTGTSYFYDSVDEQQITTEFNIISPDNQRFTWLLGAFGVWNDYHFRRPYDFVIDLAYPFNLPAAQYKLQGNNLTYSYAAFGQIGFNITPNLKIEAGARYTESKSTNEVDVIQYGTPIAAYQSVKSDNVSYKVSLGWKASQDHYFYGFVATGFRPGGLNLPVGLGNPAPFKPEEITSYEGGWKGNFAGGKVRTTVSAFYNDYKNFQVIIGYPTFPTFGIELNVPNSTKIYGFEAQADLHLGNLKLGAGVNVLRSELGQFYASDPRIAATGACDPLTGGSALATNCINLKGRRQTYAPDLTFNFSAEYTLELGNGDKLTPRANFGHIGQQWATLFENVSRGDSIVERNILNAQIAYNHGTWTLTAYGTNLTNQHYPAALNSGLYFAGTPRQYGVKLLKTF